jgi:hypothetical protein
MPHRERYLRLLLYLSRKLKKLYEHMNRNVHKQRPRSAYRRGKRIAHNRTVNIFFIPVVAPFLIWSYYASAT